MRMEGWFVNRTRNERLRGGRILLCSAFCFAGNRGMSPRVVNLAGRCLHAPKHSPPPLRLPQSFQHRSLGCVCVGEGGGGVLVWRRSIFSCQSLDRDFVPPTLQSMLVATAGVSRFSRPLSLPVSVPRFGCHFVGGFGFGWCSSNEDPDLSEDDSSTGSSSVASSPSSSSTSGCVVVSPSHYPTPEEPVVSSAASSVLISPNRVREDCVSVTAEVYPVFEVSPDTRGSVLTSPPGPPSSPTVSLPPLALRFSPPGAPLSLDGLVLALPLFPVPDVMVLVPVVAPVDLLSSPERPTRGEKSRDFSWEGPFAVSEAPSDTGVCPLVTDMLRAAHTV